MPQPIILFDYDKVTKEVIASGISKKDIFIYHGTPYEKEFQNFFWVAQTLLNLAEKEIGIFPARVFYNNSRTLNAKAGKRNGLYLINLNSGLIVQTSEFFRKGTEIINQPNLTFFEKIRDQLPDSIPTLMRDFSVRFTIDHEFCHLFQKRSLNDNWMEQEYSSEKPEDFSIEKHILEFDADFWGASGVASAVYTYFEGLDNAKKTENMLSALSVIGVTSLICKFYMTQMHAECLYFREYKHPHPIIRAMNICTHFTWTIADNLGSKYNLEWTHVLGNAIYLADLLLNKNGLQLKENILLSYVTNFKLIQEYLDIINMEASNFNNLIIHNRPVDKVSISWDKIFSTFKSNWDNPKYNDILVGRGSNFVPI